MAPRPGDRAETLVVGAAGMLGRAMLAACRASGRHATGADLGDIDITDAASVQRTISPECEIVINCAAYTDVDRAESEEELAHAVNALGPSNLARRCAEIGATLVHISTDYVFDGRASAPYRTTAQRQPIGAYGRTKAAGEEAIESSDCGALIVRTSWLYAPWGKNFVRTIARLCAEKDELRVVNDQRGRPTSAEGLAGTILGLLDANCRGVRHATDGGECTWFELATLIARESGGGCRVLPCTTEEFPRPAPRPRYSVLDLSETEAVVGPMRFWQDAVRDTLRRLEKA